jgi:endonuclease III
MESDFWFAGAAHRMSAIDQPCLLQSKAKELRSLYRQMVQHFITEFPDHKQELLMILKKEAA